MLLLRDEILLDKIADDIGNYCVKWGRIGVTQTKSKYNTVRVYCHFGIWNLHSLIFPNYVYKHYKYPDWLWKLDCDYISKIFSLFNFFVIPYQQFIYKRAYWKYIKKYPHLFDEITSCADYSEILGFNYYRLCSECANDHNNTYICDSKNCEKCLENSLKT